MSKGGGHLRQASVLKEPYQGEGPPSQALDSRPRAGCQVRPSVTNPRGTVNDSAQAPD